MPTAPTTESAASIRMPAKYWLPLIVAVAVSTAMFLVTEMSYRSFADARAEVSRGVVMQSRLLEFEKTLIDSETSQRGFLITGREDFLERFPKALERLRWLQAELRDLIAGDREVREQFSDINGLVALKIAAMNESIELAHSGDFKGAIALLATGEGESLMNSIRAALQSINALVASRIRDQSKTWEKSVETSRTGVAIVVAVNLMLIAITALVLLRDKRRAIETMGLKATYTEQLERDVESRTRELSSLSAYLQSSTEQEKAALARELHDELGGILTPAKMDLSWLQERLAADPQGEERVRRVTKLIDEGIDMKRRIIENLRPSLLDHLGLKAALQWNVEETCKAASLECHFRLGDSVQRLPPDLEIALYRVAQESVTNTIKHARATKVELSLDRTADGLRLVIADNGIGIGDPGSFTRMSHGLAGMRHRVRSIGGFVEIRGEPGKGTVVEVLVPLRAPATG